MTVNTLLQPATPTTPRVPAEPLDHPLLSLECREQSHSGCELWPVCACQCHRERELEAELIHDYARLVRTYHNITFRRYNREWRAAKRAAKQDRREPLEDEFDE